MNKLFTKIAALALGATMAVGVGATVVGKESRRADAATPNLQGACQGRLDARCWHRGWRHADHRVVCEHL